MIKQTSTCTTCSPTRHGDAAGRNTKGLMAGARENDQETTPPRVARGWRWEQPRWSWRRVLCRSMWLRPSRWYRSRVRGGCGRMVVQLRYCLCAMKFRDRSVLNSSSHRFEPDFACWPTPAAEQAGCATHLEVSDVALDTVWYLLVWHLLVRYLLRGFRV